MPSLCDPNVAVIGTMSTEDDHKVILNERVCAQNRLAYICNVKGLSEGVGAKMDNNVLLVPGCDSGVICCSKGLIC